MKLHLSTEDLNEKLQTLFAEEGLGVVGFEWEHGDDGPELSVELGAMPDGSNRPLRDVVAELEGRLGAVELRLDTMPMVATAPEPASTSVSVVPPPGRGVNGEKKGKQAKPVQPKPGGRPTKAQPAGIYSSERLAKVAEQVKGEEHVLGPHGKLGERPLAPNESTEYPG